MKHTQTALLAVVVGLAWAVLTVPRGYTDDAKPAANKKGAAADKQADAPAEKKKFRPRLPNYYGQIGLTEAQRKQIYGIQREYFSQIAELEEKIAALEAQRDQRIYNVLTAEQKQHLFQRLEAAKKQRDARKKNREGSKSEKSKP